MKEISRSRIRKRDFVAWLRSLPPDEEVPNPRRWGILCPLDRWQPELEATFNPYGLPRWAKLFIDRVDNTMIWGADGVEEDDYREVPTPRLCLDLLSMRRRKERDRVNTQTAIAILTSAGVKVDALPHCTELGCELPAYRLHYMDRGAERHAHDLITFATAGSDQWLGRLDSRS